MPFSQFVVFAKASRLAAMVLSIGLCASYCHAQLVIAHRGASHDAPENTLAAFRLAWEQGADGIEGDFYLSKDGQVVCLHDANTQRVAGVDLKVADATLAELKALDVGKWKDPQFAGEQIPTLREVLDVVPTDKQFFIELKIGPEIIAPVRKVLAASRVKPEQIMFISFDQATVAEARKQMPRVRASWLVSYKRSKGKPPTPSAESILARLAAMRVPGLDSKCDRVVVDRAFVDQLQAGGLKELHFWTINDADTCRYFQAFNPVSITTDHPGKLRGWLNESAISQNERISVEQP